MMTADCAIVARDFDAFVDGELRGKRVLRVLRHLEHCTRCAAEVDGLRTLGDRLRAEAPQGPGPAVLDGLLGTVVSRARAEESQSWAAVFRRAREDWHWLMVGAGAVAATFVSTTTLSAILALGPRPVRGDSLSAMIGNTTLPAAMFAYTTALDRESVLMQVDDVGPLASRASVELASLVVEVSPIEAELVDALLQLVTHNGRVVALDSMDVRDRRQAEELLAQISQLRSPLPIGTTITLRNMRLSAFTRVSAKGL